MSDLSIAALVIYFKCKYQELKKLCGELFVNKLSKLLVSLKVFDPDMTLSLTNTAVMVLIGKIAFATSIDWPTVSTLLLALLSYNYKRKLNNDNSIAELADLSKLKEVEDKISELNKAFAVSTMFKK
jgi:hypothetical protein